MYLAGHGAVPLVGAGIDHPPPPPGNRPPSSSSSSSSSSSWESTTLLLLLLLLVAVATSAAADSDERGGFSSSPSSSSISSSSSKSPPSSSSSSLEEASSSKGGRRSDLSLPAAGSGAGPGGRTAQSRGVVLVPGEYPREVEQPQGAVGETRDRQASGGHEPEEVPFFGRGRVAVGGGEGGGGGVSCAIATVVVGNDRLGHVVHNRRGEGGRVKSRHSHS